MEREWMKEARKSMGLSTIALAKEMNVCRSHITQIEKGIKSPSGKLALRLARFLDVNMEKFYEDELEKDLELEREMELSK